MANLGPGDFCEAATPGGARDRRLTLLLDYEEAARALSLTRAALRDLVYKGRGPAVIRIGRRTLFALADLERFIEAHRQAPPPPIADRMPIKRKRGRPTVAEKMARDAAFAK